MEIVTELLGSLGCRGVGSAAGAGCAPWVQSPQHQAPARLPGPPVGCGMGLHNDCRVGVCPAQGARADVRAGGAGGSGSIGHATGVCLLCILNLALLMMLMINDGIYFTDLLVKFKGTARTVKTYFLC